MMFSRFYRRCAALAAAAAIALQALWPLLAQARPEDPTLQVPLCTVEGVTHSVEIKVSKTTPLDERSASHGDHCKLCVFGDGKGVALVAADCLPLTSGNFSNQKIEFAKAFFHQEPLNSAHPRAPPQAS
jgi:hypothetical protein